MTCSPIVILAGSGHAKRTSLLIKVPSPILTRTAAPIGRTSMGDQMTTFAPTLAPAKASKRARERSDQCVRGSAFAKPKKNDSRKSQKRCVVARMTLFDSCGCFTVDNLYKHFFPLFHHATPIKLHHVLDRRRAHPPPQIRMGK